MALETVLVAVGPDTQTTQLAEETINVAAGTGARVVLGHVFTEEEYESALDRLEFDTVASEVDVDQVARRHVATHDIAGMLDEADVEYEIRGAIGDHADAIVSLAEAVEADRILVGGRGRSPAGKAVFGSTAQEVMLAAPCPVTFVRQKEA